MVSALNISDLEYVQLWFLKTSLGIKSQTSNWIVYGDTGRRPLLLRQQDIALKYWDRSRCMDNDKPLYKVYNELVELHNNGHKTWYTKILDIVSPLQQDAVFKNLDLNSVIRNSHVSIYSLTRHIRYDAYSQNFLTA